MFPHALLKDHKNLLQKTSMGILIFTKKNRLSMKDGF